MNLDFIGCLPQKITQFNKSNIYTVSDLVKTLPKKYLDYRNPKRVLDIKEGQEVSVVVTVKNMDSYFGMVDVIVFHCEDEFGDKMDIKFFNMPYIAQMIDMNEKYIFCGKVSLESFRGVTLLAIINPTRYSKDIEKYKTIVPVYKKINRMSEQYYEEKITNAVSVIDKEDYIEPILQNKYGIVSEFDAITKIHMPETLEDIKQAQERILFDDLFYYNYIMMKQSNRMNNTSPFVFKHYKQTREFLGRLPYTLTEGQRSTLNSLAQTTRDKKRINAVIMGDVGCGKTVVAELAMLMAFDEGYQSVLLAPTVVLANQHYKDIQENMSHLGVQCALLTSQTKASEKKKILAGIKDGSIHMVVGTHSVLNPEIIYHNLALTVIDEEHKFGVKQREMFREKAILGVHNISMSATPIPRTLAMSLYGNDTQVYTIKTLPDGRKPIKTVYKKSNDTAFSDIETQLVKGRQVYIVCPLVEKSDSASMQQVKSSEEMYEIAKKHFSPLGYKVAHINAKMKQNIINETIEKFDKKEFDILITTTIIEVGVNIPNATIIYITSAERFGLAQLHQLRGRVGRGSDQGYCLLGGKLTTPQSKEKIRTMCETTDGFKIAAKDLELRGCGDFIGTTQSGDNKYVMLIFANEKLNNNIQKDIAEILKDADRNAWYETKMKKQYQIEYS